MLGPRRKYSKSNMLSCRGTPPRTSATGSSRGRRQVLPYELSAACRSRTCLPGTMAYRFPDGYLSSQPMATVSPLFKSYNIPGQRISARFKTSQPSHLCEAKGPPSVHQYPAHLAYTRRRSSCNVFCSTLSCSRMGTQACLIVQVTDDLQACTSIAYLDNSITMSTARSSLLANTLRLHHIA